MKAHRAASLYEAGPPAGAKRLATKLEPHGMSKHGGWLNTAEIELGALAGQRLDWRLPDRETLEAEVAAGKRAQCHHQRGQPTRAAG